MVCAYVSISTQMFCFFHLKVMAISAAWVEITGVIGTARARLQLISDPPL